MRQLLKTVLVAAIVAALAATSLSMAAGSKSGTTQRAGHRPDAAVGRVLGRGYVAAVADRLGVSESQLKAALQNAHQQVGPPERPTTKPSRDEMQKLCEQQCTKVTDAVAQSLGKTGDEVRGAFKSVARERVEQAASDGRLSQSQAHGIESRIDSSSCFLPPPPGGPHGPGPQR